MFAQSVHKLQRAGQRGAWNWIPSLGLIILMLVLTGPGTSTSSASSENDWTHMFAGGGMEVERLGREVEPGVKRSRMAVLHPEFFLRLGTVGRAGSAAGEGAADRESMRLVVALFEGREHFVMLRRGFVMRSGTAVFHGTVEGHPGGEFLLTHRDGLVAGTMLIPGEGTYQILPLGEDVYRVVALDPRHGPACGLAAGKEVRERFARMTKPLPQPSPWEGEGDGTSATATTTTSLLETSGAMEDLSPTVSVELLMLYTKAAKKGAGGEDLIRVLIEHGVAEANRVMENSGVNVAFDLVHVAEVDYEESGRMDLDLARLRERRDGFMDEAHGLRDEWQADLVSLVTEHSEDWSGLAYVSPDANSAFSVVLRRYVVGHYFLAHELAHNFGCDHDRENATGKGAYSFSFGHRLQAGSRLLRTVMAYAPGQVIPHFSNPDVSYEGMPTGVAEGQAGAADNARTLRLNAPYVDHFRGLEIRLLKPADGAVFRMGEAVDFEAVARATDQGAVRVEFKVNGQTAGSSGAPYRARWTPPGPGRFLVTARAMVEGRPPVEASFVQVGVRPANDDFADRLVLEGEEVSDWTNLYVATGEVGEPRHFGFPSRTVWWSWTAPGSGTLRIHTTEGRSSGPRVAVYRGDRLDALALVGRTDETGYVTLGVNGGDRLEIVMDGRAVAGVPGSTATGLHLTLHDVPVNDRIQGALPLSEGSLHFTLAGAGRHPGEPELSGLPHWRTLWFVWRAPSDGVLFMKRASGTGDFAVFTGSGLNDLRLEASSREAAAGIEVRGGWSYYTMFEGPMGNAALEMSFTAAPTNRTFATRQESFSGQLAINTISAARELNEPAHGPNAGGKSAWWVWRAPADGGLTMEVAFRPRPLGAPFASAQRSPFNVAVYTGTSLSDLVPVKRFGFSGRAWELGAFEAVRGTEYVIAVESAVPLENGWLEMMFRGAEASDLFAQRGPPRPIPNTRSISTFGGSAEWGEPDHGGAPAKRSAWLSFRSQAEGLLGISIVRGRRQPVTGSAAPGVAISGSIGAAGGEGLGLVPIPRVAVYEGNSLESLSRVADNMSGGFAAPSFVFPSRSGAIYQVAVDEDEPGPEMQLSIQFLPPVSNDDFDRRQVLSTNPWFVAGRTLGATAEPGEVLPEGMGDGATVWYSWQASKQGNAYIEAWTRRGEGWGFPWGAFPSEFDPMLTVYRQHPHKLERMAEARGMASFPSVAGETFAIRVAAAQRSASEFFLNAGFKAENDHFASALPVEEGTISATMAYTPLATGEPGEPDHAGVSAGRSLWWAFTPQITGVFRLEGQGLTLSRSLVAAVYEGERLEGLQLVADSLSGRLTFLGRARQPYRIVLDTDRYVEATTTHHGLSWTVRFVREPGVVSVARMPGDGWRRIGVVGSHSGNFLLQSSEDLQRWTRITNVVSGSGVWTFDDFSDEPARFFRVVPEP